MVGLLVVHLSFSLFISCMVVRRRSPAGTAGSNPAGGMDVCMSVVCCQVEVSATGRSLVQRSHTDCGVSHVCDQVK